MIANYFVSMGFNEKDLVSLGLSHAVYFVHSLVFNHEKLQNEEFFKIARYFIMNNIEYFNKI